MQNQYFNSSGGNCPTCTKNTGVSAARFGDYKIILGSSCTATVVPWPKLAPSPVPFGNTTGWVCEGANWAYAGLLKHIDSGTGLVLGGEAEEIVVARAQSGATGSSSDWATTTTTITTIITATSAMYTSLESGAGPDPDPTCTTGIPVANHSGGAYCCLKSCTKCGCPGGQPHGPGGKDGCCAEEIFRKDLPCSKNPPPCEIRPEVPTPAPGPGPPGPPKGKKGCLFNLAKDVSESTNLRNDPAHADIWEQLVKKLEDRAATGPPLASAYPLGEKNHTATVQVCDIAKRMGVLLPADY